MMLNPWYCATLLAFEAHDVMRLRTMKIVGGGSDAFSEVHLMIAEKIGAAVEAVNSLMFGGTPMSVIERYREHVAANAYRLVEDPTHRRQRIGSCGSAWLRRDATRKPSEPFTPPG